MKLLQNVKRGKKGFTLIEIVIVLAIAALILVIVFLAIAGAQRSQRDNASLDGAGKVIAAYQSYLTDNASAAPTSSAAMGTSASGYLLGIKDGRGKDFVYTTSNPSVTASTTSFYMPKGVCVAGVNPASDSMTQTGGDTQVAVLYWSENAKKAVCKSN